MRFILLLAIYLLLPRVGFSADEKPLEFYVVHYPPYEIIDISGEIYGIDVDVTKAAFTAVGIPIEVKTAPWKRILKNIEYGRIPGTITCSKRPGRELYMDYSDPISQAQQAVFSAVSTPVPYLKQFSDIEDYTVTVVDGWGIQKELDIAGIDHLPTVDVASGINAIVYRDVELFYNGYLTTQYQAKQMGLEDHIKVSFLEDRVKTDFHVCFSKSYSDSRDLKQLFNKGLDIIKKNGVFDAIYQRYVHMELSKR